jgi:hypothetical protein
MRQTLTLQLGRAIGWTCCGRQLVDVAKCIVGTLLGGSRSTTCKLEPSQRHGPRWRNQSRTMEAVAAVEWIEGQERKARWKHWESWFVWPTSGRTTLADWEIFISEGKSNNWGHSLHKLAKYRHFFQIWGNITRFWNSESKPIDKATTKRVVALGHVDCSHGHNGRNGSPHWSCLKEQNVPLLSHRTRNYFNPLTRHKISSQQISFVYIWKKIFSAIDWRLYFGLKRSSDKCQAPTRARA